jgi:hypothetical protein
MTPAPKRRWFRYSLRTLFVVVTVFGVWLGFQLKTVRDRRDLTDWLSDHNGLTDVSKDQTKIAIWRRWMGDRAFDTVLLDRHARMPKGVDLVYIRDTFPEARLGIWSGRVEEVEGRPSPYWPRIPGAGFK